MIFCPRVCSAETMPSVFKLGNVSFAQQVFLNEKQINRTYGFHEFVKIAI